jgi:hypothetical protein
MTDQAATKDAKTSSASDVGSRVESDEPSQREPLGNAVNSQSPSTIDLQANRNDAAPVGRNDTNFMLEDSIRREALRQIEAAWDAQQRLMRAYVAKVEEEKQ